MSALREYQALAIGSLRRALGSGRRAPVLVAPTGSGKTRVAGEICLLAKARGGRIMFVAPRRKLVLQSAKAFRKLGLDVGLVMAGHRARSTVDVLVASMQTLIARMENGLPEVSGIIVDECHESTLGAVKTLVEKYREQGVFSIGLTATPARGDGRGLGEVFDELVLCSNVAELTALGHLVPVKYFAPSEPDLKGVRITAGDYNQKQLGERMRPLIGDVVENWKRIAAGQKTVVFTVTIANAIALCDAFLAEGIAAGWISGETPEDQQAEIFARHESGQMTVLCNAQLLSFGWDSPAVTCCVLAKPTKSIAAYLQMAGRVLRPCDGKTHATLIDHSGVVAALGFVDDDFGWTLDGKCQAAENRSRKAKNDPKPMLCLCCKTLHSPAPACPACGFSYPPKVESPETIAADLEEIRKSERKAKNKLRGEMTQEDKARFYAELRGWCQEKGKKDGMAYYMYRERFDAGPAGAKPDPRPPSKITLDWIRSHAIARAKQREAAERKAVVAALDARQ